MREIALTVEFSINVHFIWREKSVFTLLKLFQSICENKGVYSFCFPITQAFLVAPGTITSRSLYSADYLQNIPSPCYVMRILFIYLFIYSFIYLGSVRDLHANDRNATRSHVSSLSGTAAHTFPNPGRRPRRASNRGEAFGAPVQSERGGRAVGGNPRAAPERDVEIVEERRLVGHECHSLRVLIIWRGVCSARPDRLSRWKIQEEPRDRT